MEMSGRAKREVLRACLERFADSFHVLPMREHARALASRADLPTRPSTSASPAGHAGRDIPVLSG
jgi:hypothetical protein